MLDPTSEFRLPLSLQYRRQRVEQIAKRDSGDREGGTDGKGDAGGVLE